LVLFPIVMMMVVILSYIVVVWLSLRLV